MKKMRQIQRNNEKGFTLVELAIVMIIIGLLIGGVLKGQDLINNAQVAAVVTEMKGFDAAINTFRDTYAGYPGDLTTPAARIPNCNNAPCSTVGNGNGRIGVNGIFTVTNGGSENLSAWAQLERAGTISAVDGSATIQYGQALPQSAMGAGGYMIAFHQGGGAAVGGTTAPSGHYLQLAGLPTAAVNTAAAGFLAASMAARIDRKMDNGLPDTGSVREVSGTACVVAGPAYDEANNPASCSLVVGMSN